MLSLLKGRVSYDEATSNMMEDEEDDDVIEDEQSASRWLKKL